MYFPMEIVKIEAHDQSFRMKVRNADLYLKEATVIFIYNFHPLTARLPALDIASKLERLDCSHLFNSEHRGKLSTDYTSGQR